MIDAIIQGGYKVLYYNNYADTQPKLLHDPTTSKTNKLSGGKVNQTQNMVDEFTFLISMQNTYYQKLEAINGLVEVINLFDGVIEFRGRILEISGEMAQGGVFHQEVVCEGVLGYLKDMTMMYEKRPNLGPGEFLEHLISFHNARVESHKQFKLGNVNVPKSNDAPYLFFTFETGWNVLKDRLIDKFGGYIILRPESDGNYIDYLKEVGVHKKTPIQLGRNIKSSTRNISLAEMMTQIVPVGGDLQSDSTNNDEIRNQLTITTVSPDTNMHIKDQQLIDQFGVIRKVVTWSEITDPHVLYARGQQYLDNQRVALANWTVSVVDRALIDGNYEKFELYNYHPIINAPLSGIEELQIIEKEIDILNPQSVDLTIGADRLTLSSFQLQQQAAQKSMEKVMADQQAQQNIANQISLLQVNLYNYQTESDSYAVEIQGLTDQVNVLDQTNDAELIKSLTSQRQIAIDKKAVYDQKIAETKQQIIDLGGTV
ncbi:phage tail protein [Streptococcus parauberis]|uniref:phage tail protein n=1 Tax=Streptococcus parauberis TaxID=1348 RepID=UPI000E30AFDF|nr:phage tail protein [Streptococcus parauberis]RFE01067.1 hypothetical protein ADO06_01940 [Streptococcus parauberis]